MDRVFIIEKDEQTATVLAESLNALNYIPEVFSYQENLTDQLKNSSAGIFIINLQLYHLYEEQLLKFSASKESNQEKIHLILTSNAITDPVEIRALGADFFLLKPYDLETLAGVLHKTSDLIADLK